MTFNGLAACFAASLALVAPLHAAQEQWKCEIDRAKELKEGGKASFVNGPVFLWIESGQNIAHAADPVIGTVFKRPIGVKVQKNTGQIFRASWIIERGRDAKGKSIPKIRYGIIVNKQSGEVNYYANPLGYSNSFGASGDCKRTRLKPLPKS